MDIEIKRSNLSISIQNFRSQLKSDFCGCWFLITDFQRMKLIGQFLNLGEENIRKNTRCCLFKIWLKLVHNDPEAEAKRSFAQRRISRQKEPVLRRLRETPLGFCLRVIVKKFHPNLEKTKSSVLSFILINLCNTLYKLVVSLRFKKRKVSTIVGLTRQCFTQGCNARKVISEVYTSFVLQCTVSGR